MNIADKCLYRGTFYYQHFSQGILHGPQIIPLIYVTPQLFARLRVSRIISRVSERDPIQRMVDEFSRHKKKKKKKYETGWKKEANSPDSVLHRNKLLPDVYLFYTRWKQRNVRTL